MFSMKIINLYLTFSLLTITINKICLGCSLTNFKLISKPSNSSSIEYKLNEDIFISSNIEFNCEELFSIKYQWIIYNCTLNCSILNKFDKNI